MSIESKLKILIQLANVDGDFGLEEKKMIYSIGEANGIDKKDIDNYVKNSHASIPIHNMSDDDKFQLVFIRSCTVDENRWILVFIRN